MVEQENIPKDKNTHKKINLAIETQTSEVSIEAAKITPAFKDQTEKNDDLRIRLVDLESKV